MDDHMTIGELARRGGVHVETVRYYQQIGLLATPRRPQGSVRRYDAAALDRLGFIRRAQDAGFALKEIAELLRLADRPDCRGARSLATAKLAQVEARIAGLERMRAALRGLVRQCDAGAPSSCAIIERFAGREPARGGRGRGA